MRLKSLHNIHPRMACSSPTVAQTRAFSSCTSKDRKGVVQYPTNKARASSQAQHTVYSNPFNQHYGKITCLGEQTDFVHRWLSNRKRQSQRKRHKMAKLTQRKQADSVSVWLSAISASTSQRKSLRNWLSLGH